MKRRIAFFLIVCMLASMVPAAMGEGVRLNADNDVGALQMDESIQILDGASVSLELNGGLELETGILDLSGETGGEVKTEGGTDEVTLEGQVEEETGTDATQTGTEDGGKVDEEVGAVEIDMSGEGLPGEQGSDENAQNGGDLPGMDNEALLRGYLERVLPGMGGTRSNNYDKTGRQSLVDKGLTGSVKLYDLLESKIKAVASGKTTSTVFKFTDKEMGLTDSWWTGDKDGLNKDLNKGSNVPALMAKEGIDLVSLRWALWADYPYDLFWFDRAEISTLKYKVDYVKENKKIVRVRLSNLVYSMPVALDYRVKAKDLYKINKLPKQISASASNIKKIVNKYKKLDDYEKLRAYADEICHIVEYNEAMESDTTNPYTGPESLIPVFDGDKKTDTVCSGYAKAFKYLVDISKFKGPVACEMMNGKVHGPSHVWDVVSMPDGRYYLVDLSAGDSGDNCRDSMFMKACIGEPGFPYVCNSRQYILNNEDAYAVFGDGSPWLKLSNGDYGKDYMVVITAKNGSMTATPNMANPGDTVKLTVSPSIGCKTVTPVVKFGASRKKVALKKVNGTTWSFKMPFGEVYAQAEFTPKSKDWHTINGIGAIEGGTITAKVSNKSVAGTDKGKKVILAVTPDKGFIVKTPKLTQSGKKVSLKKAGKNTWTFEMPNEEVEVSGAFKVDDSWKTLQKKIDKAKNGSVVKLTKDVSGGSGNVGLVISKKKNITLDLAGHTLDRGLVSPMPNGYAIKVLGKLTVTDSSSKKSGKITGAYNAEHGGAIDVDQDASLTLKGGKIYGNQSVASGGAVHVMKGADFTMSGGTISDNVSSMFGAVYAEESSFTMSGGTISDNTSTTCGGVAVVRGNFKMSGGKISGNKADCGAGIYLQECDLKMSGGTIGKNKCSGKGGGAYVIRGVVSLTGGTISDNTSTSEVGGGIYVFEGGSFTIDGGKITGNTATNGGGMYLHKTPLKIKKGTVSGNTSTADVGGGISLVSENCTMTGGTISGNTSSASGGGICVAQGTFELGGGTISDNTAKGENYGGGVYVSEGKFVMSNGTVSGNRAGTGGGVYARLSPFDMSGGFIQNNSSASVGGGVTIYQNNGTMTGGTLTGNTSDQNGGAISVAQGTFSLGGGTISNNTAKGKNYGGGVYVSEGKFVMSNGTVSGNRAGTGGGVYARLSPFDMSGGFIQNNSSTSVGGGVTIYQSNGTMTGGIIAGNTSDENGGGISVAQGTFSLGGGAISDNTAKGKNYGGGVYVSEGQFVMSNGTVSGNQAGTGGGVYARLSPFDMSGGLIQNNKATGGAGGGVVVFQKGGKMTGGTVTGNTSNDNGGGIAVWGGGDFEFSNGTISSNSSNNSNGGGLFFADGNLTVSSGAIKGNRSGLGGGIYTRSATLTMRGGEITENIASDNGGGLIFIDSRFKISGSPVVTGNTGASEPNNIYVGKTDVIVIDGALTADARLGITSKYPMVFTSGLGGNGNIGAFSSDNSSWEVARTQDGAEAELVNAN